MARGASRPRNWVSQSRPGRGRAHPEIVSGLEVKGPGAAVDTVAHLDQVALFVSRHARSHA
eukprot:scaffold14987_cov84-Isochrysis_galbana.AAC.2